MRLYVSRYMVDLVILNFYNDLIYYQLDNSERVQKLVYHFRD